MELTLLNFDCDQDRPFVPFQGVHLSSSMEKFIHSLEEDDFDVDNVLTGLVEGVENDALMTGEGEDASANHLLLFRNWKRKLREFEKCKSEEVTPGSCDVAAEEVYRYSFGMSAPPCP